MTKLIYKSKRSENKIKTYSILKFKDSFDNEKEGSKNVGVTAELADGSVKRFRWDRVQALFRV
jgi:hypothetical protein